MSAKIYSLPTELENKVPNIFDVDNSEYERLEKQFIKSCAEWCRSRNNVEPHKYIGEIIRFPVADGYAEYMVAGLKPLQLIHLPLMDAYEAPDVDLMTANRVKEKLAQQKKLKALFGGK